MEKKLIISLFILALANPGFAYDILPEAPEDLQEMQNNFFQLPSAVPDVEVDDQQVQKQNDGRRNLRSTPVFKKYRIRFQRKYHKLEQKTDEKILEFQEKHFKPKADDADSLIFKQTTDSENDIKEMNIKLNKPETKIEGTVQTDEAIMEPSEKSLELEGGVKELVVEKDMMLDCDQVEYFEDKEEIEATGNPILIFPPQGVSIKADRMTYHVPTNILKCYDNVQIIKDGKAVLGDYIQINLNEENGLIDNVRAPFTDHFIVRAKKAKAMEDVIVLENGDMKAQGSYILNLETRMRGPRLRDMILDDEDKSYFTDIVDAPDITLQAKEIIVDAKRDHDIITFKEPVIFNKDNRLFGLPSFTAHTDKEHTYFEANYPEFGSITRIGMYAGPGFVFNVPYIGSTLKVVPFLNYKSDIGIGATAKYRSANNFTQFSYGSAKDVFVLRGRQELDDNLFLQYGVNAYLDDWFLGMRMPHYGIQAIYDKKYPIPNFLGEKKRMQFRHRIGAGYFAENDMNLNSEDIEFTDEKTGRLKYMAEVDQSFYRYEDKEKKYVFDVGMVLQGSAALYGTGDSQFIGRIGPRVRTQYKYWMQDIGYFLSGYNDSTPMPRFDAYRYGHSNIYIREALRVNKWLTLAWSGSINTSGDSYNGKPFQENAFIVAFGPDDLKVSLGYDFVRTMTYFMVSMAMDMKNSSVTYDKMVIKNPDRLGKSEHPTDESEFKEAKEPRPHQNRVYAEIINIEDPNKEKI